ncbi:MAG: ribosome silencing factor [Clostridiales bacterium]|nr:ribosome silencing factor [Clostridiales bacterium]
MDQDSLALKIAKVLYDKKALDIKVLHVGHLTVITDYMVIASGRSALQVKALADDVEDALAAEGIFPRAKEGTGEGRWIVEDYTSVLVHIFHPEDREFYHLERLWEDGQNLIELPFAQED